MQYADELARRAGTTLEQVAQSWPYPRYKMKPHTLKGRVARIRAVTRHGGLNDASALHLAYLLGCNPLIFLRGYEHAYGLNVSSDAMSIRGNETPARTGGVKVKTFPAIATRSRNRSFEVSA